ncbi:unnamed protein product [Rodentolepis nana]|uniref:Reverse transcriptase domain-containing protein n=1 Tax=Rodentolepis nana TaxID=102285 RepID=A0A0R3TRT3_RODNA|nr:unnamed protein product [Rodentolepis nana]
MERDQWPSPLVVGQATLISDCEVLSAIPTIRNDLEPLSHMYPFFHSTYLHVHRTIIDDPGSGHKPVIMILVLVTNQSLLATIGSKSMTRKVPTGKIIDDPGSGHKPVREIIDDPGSGHKPSFYHRQQKHDKESANVGGKSMTMKVPTKSSWNFKKFDWPRIINHLDSELHTTPINFNQHPDKLCNDTTKIMIRFATETISRGKTKHYRVFWSKHLEKLKRKRDALRNTTEQTGKTEDVQAWRRQSAVLRQAILQVKRTSFDNFISNINYQSDSQRTFKFLKNLQNKRERPKKETIRLSNKDTSKTVW